MQASILLGSTPCFAGYSEHADLKFSQKATSINNQNYPDPNRKGKRLAYGTGPTNRPTPIPFRPTSDTDTNLDPVAAKLTDDRMKPQTIHPFFPCQPAAVPAAARSWFLLVQAALNPKQGSCTQSGQGTGLRPFPNTHCSGSRDGSLHGPILSHSGHRTEYYYGVGT